MFGSSWRTQVENSVVRTMGNFFDQRYYSLNKFYMSKCGIWPEQSLLLRCLLPPISILTIVSVIIPEVIRVLDIWEDVDRVIEGTPGLLVMLASLTKLLNGCINFGKMRQVINRIARDWEHLEGTKGVEVLHAYAARGRLLTVAYSIYVYSSVTLFLILPVMPCIFDVIKPLNESRPRKALFEAEYGVDPDDYFFEILFHSYVTTLATVYLVVTSDTMFFVNVQHACALFKVVSVNLKLSLEDKYSNDDEHFKTIRYCINLHKDALSFTDLLESTYSTSFAIVIFIYLLVMSLSGVLVVVKMGQTDDMIRFGNLALGVAVTLFLNSVPGQSLIDHSLDIHTVAYNFEWYEMSSKLQKLVVPMMVKSMRPSVLTAGKIYIVSMENYSSVMQKAMSYFTVLSSMR